MILTRRDLVRGGTVAAAALALPRAGFAAPADADEVVLARATGIVLAARETHVVLSPVPAPRRPQSKSKTKAKGARSAPRTHLVLRGATAAPETPVHDVYLLLEGPNVFEATVTRLHLGELKPPGEKGGTVQFDATDVMAKFARTPGYNIRHLRVAIVRRSAAGVKAPPPPSKPPEIGAIELVRS